MRQKEAITVLVSMDIDKTADPEQIRQIPVPAGGGEAIPLDRIASISVSHVPSSITRLNGQREITLLAEVEGNIFSLVSRLRDSFRVIDLPEGYSLDFTGQYKVLPQTLSEMLLVFLAAVAFIYLIMAIQFRSLLQPLIILATIPLSLVGALIALFISRQGVDVSVGMGLITLAGMSVNNAIVLLDYSNRKMVAGKTLPEALLSAASVRLRPILMTALTTIFALIPIAAGTTVGSRIFQPFAITVIGGLLSGTFATLVVVPTLFATVSRKALSQQERG